MAKNAALVSTVLCVLCFTASYMMLSGQQPGHDNRFSVQFGARRLSPSGDASGRGKHVESTFSVESTDVSNTSGEEKSGRNKHVEDTTTMENTDVTNTSARQGLLITSGKDNASSATALQDEEGACAKYRKDSDDYDHVQWLAICEAMDPEDLQPFYFMPVAMGMKLLATYLTFGLDLVFKRPEKEPEDGCRKAGKRMTDTFKLCLKKIASLVFIALAVNTYIHDFEAWRESCTGNFWKDIGLVFIVWVTSPNFPAATMIWSTFKFQSPSVLLKLTPKYIAIPYIRVPLIPGGANWLPIEKHLYALILLPYFIPMALYYLLFIPATCACGIMTKCICCIGCIQQQCCCLFTFLGVVFTLGLHAGVKEEYGGYWDRYKWSLLTSLYYTFLQFWASTIAPILMTGLYALGMRASFEHFTMAVTLHAMPGLTDEVDGQTLDGDAVGKAVLAGRIVLNDADRKLLIDYNRENIKGDFEEFEEIQELISPISGRGGSQQVMGGEDRKKFDYIKIQVFLKTLQALAYVMLWQALYIYFARGFASHTYYGFEQALQVTVNERHMTSYVDNLRTLGQSHISSAMEVAQADHRFRSISRTLFSIWSF